MYITHSMSVWVFVDISEKTLRQTLFGMMFGWTMGVTGVTWGSSFGNRHKANLNPYMPDS
jgi:hypothetical protein